MSIERKIYEFSIPDYVNSKKIGNYNWRIRKTDEYSFIGCQMLDLEDTYDLILDVRCPIEKIMHYDVLPNNFGSPIVKGEALEILQELCSDEFQVFDCEIQGTEGSTYEYKILNLLREIHYINFKRSDCRYFDDGDVASIEKLVMHPHAMDDIYIGRLKDMHPMILTSDTVQKAFKKAKIKGVNFREIEIG